MNDSCSQEEISQPPGSRPLRHRCWKPANPLEGSASPKPRKTSAKKAEKKHAVNKTNPETSVSLKIPQPAAAKPETPAQRAKTHISRAPPRESAQQLSLPSFPPFPQSGLLLGSPRRNETREAHTSPTSLCASPGGCRAAPTCAGMGNLLPLTQPNSPHRSLRRQKSYLGTAE